MLGQLFQALKSPRYTDAQPEFAQKGKQHDAFCAMRPLTTNTGAKQPESVFEDAHTLGLLFPSTDSVQNTSRFLHPLQEAATSGLTGFDTFDRDAPIPDFGAVRILVGQDEVGTMQKAILYDTRPLDRAQDQERPNLPPDSTRLSGNSSSQARRPAVHARTSSLHHASGLVEASKGPDTSSNSRHHARGHSVTSIPENSTTSGRREAKERDDELRSCLDCMFGNGTLSSTGPINKLHVLPHNSYEPAIGSISPPHSSYSSWSRNPVHEPRHNLDELSSAIPTKKSLLITRVFSIDRISINDNDETPDVPDVAAKRSLHESMRQYKAPLYAVAIVVSLGMRRTKNDRMSSSRRSQSSGNHQFSSFFAPSFASEFHSSETPKQNLLEEEDYVMHHWDTIVSVLACLQDRVQSKLAAIRAIHLQQRYGANLDRSLTLPSIGSGVSNIRRQETFKLRPGFFDHNVSLAQFCVAAQKRLFDALSVRPVVLSQDRWAVWREEARWAYGWQSEVSDSFFSQLLTAFLATHLDWLPMISARHGRKQKLYNDTNISRKTRTVIVSSNKMAARRMIFLLSVFLPGSRRFGTSSQARPIPGGTESRTSTGTLSRSQASSMTSPEELSRSFGSTPLRLLYARKSAVSSTAGTSSTTYAGSSQPEFSPTEWRSSRLVKSGVAPPTLDAAGAFHTAPPSSWNENSISFKRRGSSGSAASSSLAESLKGQDDYSTSLSRPASQTRNHRLPVQSRSSTESLARRQLPPTRTQPRSHGSTLSAAISSLDVNGSKLDQMVEELNARKSGLERDHLPSRLLDATGLHHDEYTSNDLSFVPLPYKMSPTNEQGFVDIDISYRTTRSSYSTSTTSPSSASTNATSLTPSLNTPFKLDMSDTRAKVAGYLPTFQEDLILQAVPPYPALDANLKSVMGQDHNLSNSSKSLPSLDNTTDWIVVSKTLVINLDRCSVSSLTARSPKTTKGNPPSANCSQVSERLETSVDSILADAIERLVGHSGQSSRTVSNLASHNRSPALRIAMPNRAPEHPPHPAIPREECKAALFSALQSILKDATSGRGSVTIDQSANQEFGSDSGDESSVSKAVRNCLNSAP